MKSTVFVFVVALAVWAECGNHNRKHNRHEDTPDEGDVIEWPTTNAVFGFQIPDIFTAGFGSNDSEDASSGKHHTKLSSKKRSH